MEKRIVNQKELIDKVAEAMGVTKKSVKEYLEAVEGVIFDEVATASAAESVEVKVIHGLTIVAEHVAEHQARNPQSGETVTAPAKNKVKAKVSKALKDAANA